MPQRLARSQPTPQAYAELQLAYDHFNGALFGGQLPGCLITLQREKRTYGYFSRNRFANLDGQLTDEIALNPCYFAVVPLVETMQTLVHEMVHQWQALFGKPGRGRYHNDQWADKMESIGLMPSSTGRPGGKRTGDHMADYAIEGGRFLQACQALVPDSCRVVLGRVECRRRNAFMDSSWHRDAKAWDGCSAVLPSKCPADRLLRHPPSSFGIH